MDIDDIIKDKRAAKFFSGYRPDPTFPTYFCRRCCQPILGYEERIDGAGNIEELYDSHCQKCSNQIRNECPTEGETDAGK